MEVVNFCAAMDTLIDQDGSRVAVAESHGDQDFSNIDRDRYLGL